MYILYIILYTHTYTYTYTYTYTCMHAYTHKESVCVEFRGDDARAHDN
jgi:hypothetical protein